MLNVTQIDSYLYDILPKSLTKIIFNFYNSDCDNCNTKYELCHRCTMFYCKCAKTEFCSNCSIHICKEHTIFIYKICDCCDNFLCIECNN